MSAIAVLVVCTWLSRDGAVSFTDDVKRIPAAYSAVAVCEPVVGGLGGYEHFTRDDAPFVPKTAFEDAPGSTIAPRSVPEVQSETVTPITKERRPKRHRAGTPRPRSDRS